MVDSRARAMTAAGLRAISMKDAHVMPHYLYKT